PAACWPRRLPPAGSIRSLARHPAAALVVGLFLFNGLQPYLGLKTATALAEHSNLRTEGRFWNHLLLPRDVRIFNLQDRLVRVIDSTDETVRRLGKAGYLFNELEL